MKKTGSKKSRDTVPLKGDLSNATTFNPPLFSRSIPYNKKYSIYKIFVWEKKEKQPNIYHDIGMPFYLLFLWFINKATENLYIRLKAIQRSMFAELP